MNAKVYDFFLHKTFSGPLAGIAFTIVAILRNTIFTLHNIFGIITYRKKISPIIPENIKKILLIKTDRIGDIVLAMPALKALRNHYPHATIDIVVQKKYAQLLNCFEGWNSVYTLDTLTNRTVLYELGERLKLQKYDAAIVLHPAAYAFMLSRFSEATHIIGWKAKGFGFLLTHGLKDDRCTANRHQVINNLKLCEFLGVRDEHPSYPIKETEQGKNEVKAFFEKQSISPSSKILLIHPASYSPRVRWYANRFAAVGDRAIESGMTVVVIGSKADGAVVDKMVGAMKQKPVLAMDDFSIEGLVSLMCRATVFVGNSTGPVHIAAACGIWAIGIYGSQYPMDRAVLWAPFSAKGVVVSAPDVVCKKCVPWTCKNKRCLQEVTVEMVWSQIEDALK